MTYRLDKAIFHDRFTSLTSDSSHLDSMKVKHHDAYMRTTVTLDKDVERMLREEQHRSRKSFKEVLNRALRAGLTGKTVPARSSAFVIKAKPMGLRAGIDPSSLNKLTDEMELEAVLAKARPAKRR